MSREAEVEALLARHWQPRVDEAHASGSAPDVRTFRRNLEDARRELAAILPALPPGLPGRLIALAVVMAGAEMGAGYSWIRHMREMLEAEAADGGDAP